MTEPVQAPPSFPGGEYEIEGVLGAGGMAVVYRARDLRRQRTVAIKVLRAELAHVTGTERFRREITVAASFAHPHIVPLLDLGQATDAQGRAAPYYVMPLIEGETLRDRIQREQRLPLADALRFAREILRALQYAHGQSVIHRDIKPANILLADGHAMVADFGVARPIPGSGALETDDDMITRSGLTVGTPAYMSPEQALGDRFVGERTDLYALGCVLYEMLTGAPPFVAENPSSIISQKLTGVFTPVTASRPDVPPSIDQVLARALAPQQADRFESADAFLQALTAFESGSFAVESGAHRAANAQRTDAAGWTMSTWGGRAAATGDSATSRRSRTANIVALGTMAALVALGSFALRGRGTAEVATVAPDRTRIAVMPLELLAADSALASVANGLTTDLIDELARYPAIAVISRNGVAPYAGGTVPTDSIARALGVGSVVTGDLRRSGDRVTMTVRLIDGATNAQLAAASAVGALGDLLGVRSTMLDSVTTFLRRTIGEQVAERDQRVTSSPEAWELLAQARTMLETELQQANSVSARDRAARFAVAESLLLRAASLDERWAAPYVLSGRVLLQRASVEEVAALGLTTPGTDSSIDPTALRRAAVARAELALARERDNPAARHLRGKARLDLWRTARPEAPDSLRGAAESDLRAVTARRRDMADAWNDLSQLLQMSGQYEGSRAAAEEALRADAFLRSPEAVLSRLHFTALASGRTVESRRWCEEGQVRFPRDPRFWGCELTIVGWTGATPADVALAWRRLRESEARDQANLLAAGWGTRRLLVAAVAARAGLTDSAMAIVAHTRANAPANVPRDQLDYGEAHVHTLLGRTDLALPLLERYLRTNPALRGQVRSSPWFTAIRTDPRFLALTTPP